VVGLLRRASLVVGMEASQCVVVVCGGKPTTGNTTCDKNSRIIMSKDIRHTRYPQDVHT